MSVRGAISDGRPYRDKCASGLRNTTSPFVATLAPVLEGLPSEMPIVEGKPIGVNPKTVASYKPSAEAALSANILA